jgi:hypothetical protein
MPKVGNRNFDYSPEGMQQAQAYSEMSGIPMDQYNGGGRVTNAQGITVPGMYKTGKEVYKTGGGIGKLKKLFNKGRDVVRDLVSAHRHNKALKLKDKILKSNEYKILNQRFKQTKTGANKNPRNKNLEFRPHNNLDTDMSTNWKFPLKIKKANKINQLMNKNRSINWVSNVEKTSGTTYSRAKRHKDINTDWLRNLQDVQRQLKIKSTGGAAGSNGVL